MTEQGILIAGGYGVVGQRMAADLGPDYEVILRAELPECCRRHFVPALRDRPTPAQTGVGQSRDSVA
jgi:hypothetical protein